MTVNMVPLDRLVRALLALVFLYLAFAGVVGSPWNWILGVVGVVFALTAAVGFCPAYTLLGRRTR